MAVAAMKVPTIFTAVDRFSHVVSKMSGGVTKFSNTTASAVHRMDHKINGVFNSLNGISQLAIGGGLSMLFYQGGKDIMDYETKLASLAAVTGTEIGFMNKQIESLGKTTGRSVIDIAGAFEIVGSKMSEYLDNPDALKKITDGSILLANASRMELEPAIESLTQLMNIYKMTANDTSKIVNKLSAGETVGSISIAQSGDILKQFGAQAVSTNVRIEESIALIQTLTKSLGVEGVGRNLRNILFDISSTKTWDKNRWKAIRMAGVDFEFVTNKANTLTDRLTELKKLSGVKGATELFFKRTGTIGAKTLFQNFDTYKTFLTKIEQINDAEAKAAKNTGTFSYAIARLKDSFTNYMVTGGEVNTSLSLAKDLILLLTRNMGGLINTVGLLVGSFILWKGIVLASTIRLFFLNIAMGISAFRAGAMAIAMRGSSVAIGVYNLATVIATGSTATLGVSMMTVLGPIALVVGALGLLTYAFWDSGESTIDMTSKQLTALTEQNKGFVNSTKVIETELKKQQDLISGKKPETKFTLPKEVVPKKILESKVNGIYDQVTAIKPSLAKDIANPKNLDDPSLYGPSMPERFKYNLALSERDRFYENINGSNNGKSNLATGDYVSPKELFEFFKSRDANITLYIKDPGNNLDPIKKEEYLPRGIKVILGGTTGKR